MSDIRKLREALEWAATFPGSTSITVEFGKYSIEFINYEKNRSVTLYDDGTVERWEYAGGQWEKVE